MNFKILFIFTILSQSSFGNSLFFIDNNFLDQGHGSNGSQFSPYQNISIAVIDNPSLLYLDIIIIPSLKSYDFLDEFPVDKNLSIISSMLLNFLI